jgi:hypothetical protein
LALSDDKKNKRSQSAGAGQQVRTPSLGERGGPSPSSAGASGHGQSDRDVGHALRSVYSTTVNEEIPSELLDLLGKLS